MPITTTVKHEVTKIVDAVDNYERGRYSQTRTEDMVFEAAQKIVFEVKKKGITKEGIPKL